MKNLRNYILAGMIGLGSLAFTTEKALDYITENSIKRYADKILHQYNWNKRIDPRVSDEINNNELSLDDVTDDNIKEVIFSEDTNIKTYQGTINQKYRQFILNILLKDRKFLINEINEKRINEFFNCLNESAMQEKMSEQKKENLFNEIKTSTNYYFDAFKKLQAITPDKRKDIFREVAKISPRNKAYNLQMAITDSIQRANGWGRCCEELYSGKKEKVTKDLIKSFKNLQTLLMKTGININKNCKDWHNEEFTRYSRQYDYLFSTLRWATYIDSGKITEDSITGWTESTIKSIIDDGIVMLDKIKKVEDNYKIK